MDKISNKLSKQVFTDAFQTANLPIFIVKKKMVKLPMNEH